METLPVRALLHNGGFLRLLAVRLTGSFGDGLLQASLASFILFSPERQPSPLAIATSFGILLLPYSLVGPFAGVFLDRWRRRQVLARGNWLRGAACIIIAGAVLLGRDGLDLGIIVLVTLGIGRFILAGLSASLPHVVPQDQLVTANAIGPTAGTVIFGLGTLIGIVLRGVFGGGDAGAAGILLCALVVYACAGSLAMLLGKNQLGPEAHEDRETIAGVLRGLAGGFRELRSTKPAWTAIAVVVFQRAAFGFLTVTLLLLLRNTLHESNDPDAALADFAIIAGAVTLGALLAAFSTPAVTRKWSGVRWTALTTAIGGVAMAFAMNSLVLLLISIAGVLVGFAQQAAKIGADTNTQSQVDDEYLGRVFSLFDVGVNLGLVVGALLAALLIPLSGISPVVIWLLGLTYVLVAAWYWLFSSQRKPAPS